MNTFCSKARIREVASRPSMMGICMSIKMNSKGVFTLLLSVFFCCEVLFLFGVGEGVVEGVIEERGEVRVDSEDGDEGVEVVV